MALVPVLVSSVAANEVTIGLVRVGIACLVLTPLLPQAMRLRRK
jgi:hypothetical protein